MEDLFKSFLTVQILISFFEIQYDNLPFKSAAFFLKSSSNQCLFSKSNSFIHSILLNHGGKDECRKVDFGTQTNRPQGVGEPFTLNPSTRGQEAMKAVDDAHRGHTMYQSRLKTVISFFLGFFFKVFFLGFFFRFYNLSCQYTYQKRRSSLWSETLISNKHDASLPIFTRVELLYQNLSATCPIAGTATVIIYQ